MPQQICCDLTVSHEGMGYCSARVHLTSDIQYLLTLHSMTLEGARSGSGHLGVFSMNASSQPIMGVFSASKILPTACTDQLAS